jgi:hypothetical protein
MAFYIFAYTHLRRAIESLAFSSAESVRKQLKALTHKRHPWCGGCRFAAVDVVFFLSSSLFRSPPTTSVSRRREEERLLQALLQKRHLRAAIFYSFGAAGVRGQPAGRYAISRADRTHSHSAPECFSFSRRLHSFSPIPKPIRRKIAFSGADNLGLILLMMI